jgi:hypothetical protein
MSIRIGLGLVCIIACMSSVQASTSVDKSFTATSDDCSSVQWSQEAMQKYPTIASACQAVQERDGKRYVRFEGKLKRNESGKRLTIDFKNGGEVVVTPPPETNFYVDGQLTPVAKLQRGQDLNFYISEDRLAAQFPQEPETTTTHFVVIPLAVEAPAQHDTSSMTASLPHTASELPLFALVGVVTLMFAGSMTLFRVLR